MATLLRTINDPILDEDLPNSDGFQGFRETNGAQNLAQAIVLAGTFDSISVRLGRTDGTNGGQSVYVTIANGHDPSATPIATSASKTVASLPIHTNREDGDNLNTITPLTTFSFSSEVELDGNAVVVVRISAGIGSGENVPGWRYRFGNPYAAGSSFTKASNAWSELSTRDLELQIQTNEVLYWTNAGFRFPHPRWT